MISAENTSSQFRHECKHRITPADSARLICRLSALCAPDPHYGNSAYRVRSLYFDNVYDKALQERLSGVNCREKFRIRYYNGDDSYIMLEKKSKQGQLCRKESCRVSREEVQSLLQGNIQWLLHREEPLCREFYTKMHTQLLRPKVIVEYSRRAFVYSPGNARITIDSDIRTGLSSLDFFSPQLPLIPADLTHPIILEVKYGSYLPDLIRQAVQLPHRRTAGYSKYAACRLTNL